MTQKTERKMDPLRFLFNAAPNRVMAKIALSRRAPHIALNELVYLPQAANERSVAIRRISANSLFIP